jgi:hypothetical protein
MTDFSDLRPGLLASSFEMVPGFSCRCLCYDRLFTVLTLWIWQFQMELFLDKWKMYSFVTFSCIHRRPWRHFA